MPELVPSRERWGYSVNHSGPGFQNDRGAALNHGCTYIVTVRIRRTNLHTISTRGGGGA